MSGSRDGLIVLLSVVELNGLARRWEVRREVRREVMTAVRGSKE